MRHQHTVRYTKNPITGNYWVSIDYDPWCSICDNCYRRLMQQLPPLYNLCSGCIEVALQEKDFKAVDTTKKRKRAKKGFS